jgi:hypothetical protein
MRSINRALLLILAIAVALAVATICLDFYIASPFAACS